MVPGTSEGSFRRIDTEIPINCVNHGRKRVPHLVEGLAQTYTDQVGQPVHACAALRNQIQTSTISGQFVPETRFLLTDVGVLCDVRYQDVRMLLYPDACAICVCAEKVLSISGGGLCACYAMRCPVAIEFGAISLRECYAMSATDEAYGHASYYWSPGA
eukprot:3193512-Rhodomonas_salina.1